MAVPGHPGSGQLLQPGRIGGGASHRQLVAVELAAVPGGAAHHEGQRQALAILVAIAILYDLARRIGVPYPTLLVLGGLGLAAVPGIPRIELEPDLVLFVFLPPLLFQAAIDSETRLRRANVGQ